jgi:baculoviral IAP repeat-containing protein 2/3
MNYEESRLRTFESWPANAAVDARRIAKAGFYYMGRGLEVQCFSCGVRISEWNYGDKVMSRHRSLDPGCRFVQNPVCSGNVPMVNDTRRQNVPEPDSSQPSLNSAIPTHSRNSSLGVGNTMYQSEDTRTQSFSSWPIPFIISPELLVSSGFFYTQLGDKVFLFFCIKSRFL